MYSCSQTTKTIISKGINNAEHENIITQFYGTVTLGNVHKLFYKYESLSIIFFEYIMSCYFQGMDHHFKLWNLVYRVGSDEDLILWHILPLPTLAAIWSSIEQTHNVQMIKYGQTY